MAENIPPFHSRDLKGFRKYFNTYTPAGKSNLILLGVGITAGAGYYYYFMRKNPKTMKDSMNEVKQSMSEAKDAAKDKIKETVNKKL